MGKNDKEKQMLYEWAKTNGVAYHFPGIDLNRKSYFIQRGMEDGSNSYIREYGFETLPEFMKELNILWKDEKVTEIISKAVGVAAIKNKPMKVKQKEVEVTNKEEPQDKPPVFIYNF